MQTKFGSYTGTGSALSVTGVGFQPDLVICIGITSSASAHFRTSAMGTNVSIQIRGDAASVTDAIQSLDADGFTLGTSGNINTNSVTYLYIAIKDNGAGDFKVGTYTGNATDGLAVTGLGFQPNYVLCKADSAIVGASKYSSGTNSSMQFGGDNRADLIVSLDASGFTVNNGSTSGGNLINVNSATHYYFAFKEVADFCEVFQYTGNATDNRDITTPGFQPGMVLIKSQWGGQVALRTATHSGDNSQRWDGIQGANRIQSIISTGFQVGTDDSVNQNSALFNVLALKEGTNAAASTANSNFFQFF